MHPPIAIANGEGGLHTGIQIPPVRVAYCLHHFHILYVEWESAGC